MLPTTAPSLWPCVPHSPPPWAPHMCPASIRPRLVQVPRPSPPRPPPGRLWVGFRACSTLPDRHASIPTFAAQRPRPAGALAEGQGVRSRARLTLPSTSRAERTWGCQGGREKHPAEGRLSSLLSYRPAFPEDGSQPGSAGVSSLSWPPSLGCLPPEHWLRSCHLQKHRC